MEGWGEFYLGELGATAAIVGLFVVAISINIERIMQSQFLPGRAGLTILVIGAAVIISGLALFPHQALPIFGWESIAASGLIAVAGIRHTVVSVRERGKGDPLWWSLIPLVLIVTCAVPFLIGGVYLAAGAEAGMYWVASGVLVATAITLVSGWVLLIEILR
jgi:hypothetical protein